MSLSPEKTQRLAFVKYLLSIANDQTKQPEPLASAALLTFHDALEFFLELSSEHLNAGKKKMEFMDYWDVLNPKLSPNSLPQQESIRRLNKARVALKHHGTFPSRLDLNDFATSTRAFFEEATPLIFGLSLESVSLIDFISCEAVRVEMKEAVNAATLGDVDSALGSCALAFDDLLRDYEDRKRDQFHRSPFSFGKSMTFMSSFHLGLSGASEFGDVARFVDAVKQSIEDLQEAMKILVFGIDYRRYTRFQLLSPHVTHTLDGRQLYGKPSEREVKPTKEDVQFCINFVIESALRLQEFDFERDRK